jgi:hypothetical protein
MGNLICSIEIFKEGAEFIARAKLQDSNLREYRSSLLEDLIIQVMMDLEEKIP